MDVVILAGGKGTRLQTVVNDRPKPMAEVAGKPFLEYLMGFWIKQGCENLILSTGYRNDFIFDYFGTSYHKVPVSYEIEDEPLGTGGALLKAVQQLHAEEFVLVNGDSYFDFPFHKMYLQHRDNHADISMALFKAENIERYGTVSIDENNQLKSFQEKTNTKSGGWVNAGIYLINRNILEAGNCEEKFISLEKDLFPAWLDAGMKIQGFKSKGFFIDIGIPETYKNAQNLFS